MEFVSHYGDGIGQKVSSKDEGLFCHHSHYSSFIDEVMNIGFDHFCCQKKKKLMRGNVSFKITSNKIERKEGR
jgi:hypothetical protein